ncbi:MAG: acyltransferase [Eubacteriaceae bacterium]|nr:acyltransferase [Eubacteriaceae bacterium]
MKQQDTQFQSEPIKGYVYLRVIACLAIVILHTAYGAAFQFEEVISSFQHTGAMVVTNSMMWAVPCFVMVTGALLLPPEKDISYDKLFKKYIFRVARALVICGLAFRLFDMVMDGEPMTFMGFLYGFAEIFTGQGWSHLWYLYLLIGLYLLLPFYKKVTANSSDREMIYLLAVGGIFTALLPMLEAFHVSCAFYIHVATIYPFYLLMGYALRKGIVKVTKWQALGLIVLSLAAIIGMTVYRWQNGSEAFEALLGYNSLFVAALAVGVFSLVSSVRLTLPKALERFIKSIDYCSFGIYLIHMVFVRLVLRYWRFNPFTHGGVIAFAGIVIGVFIVSFVLVWLGKKGILLLKALRFTSKTDGN